MKSIVEKTLREINQLEEKATVVPAIPNAKYSSANTSPKEVDGVDVEVDTSDEKNDTNESTDIFSMFNQSSEADSLKVEVEVDDDIHEDEEQDSSDAFSESGKEALFGQGTNPKPGDETYLSLLKKTTPKAKVKIKANK